MGAQQSSADVDVCCSHTQDVSLCVTRADDVRDVTLCVCVCVSGSVAESLLSHLEQTVSTAQMNNSASNTQSVSDLHR